MNKSHNRGIYTDLITQYIAYKRSLGFKMDDTDERLRRFDRLTIERGENSIGISKELFDAWITIGSIESDYNRCHRICILKGFSIYLQQLGYESYIPKLNKCRSNYIPYIYTKAEINAILHECDKLILKKSNIPSCKFAMPALIRMLYGTGIRVGEAIKLTHRDVDLNTEVLILRECKNGQDRLVPMSLSLREVCKDYIANKQMVGLSVEDDDVFFTKNNGERCNVITVYTLFRTVLLRAGIGHGGRGKGPRLHDLRHTFCVYALAKMSEDGMDLYYSLPILMTYVGHKSLEATNRYVRMVKDMYPKLLSQVNEFYKCVFPEIEV